MISTDPLAVYLKLLTTFTAKLRLKKISILFIRHPMLYFLKAIIVENTKNPAEQLSSDTISFCDTYKPGINNNNLPFCVCKDKVKQISQSLRDDVMDNIDYNKDIALFIHKRVEYVCCLQINPPSSTMLYKFLVKINPVIVV